MENCSSIANWLCMCFDWTQKSLALAVDFWVILPVDLVHSLISTVVLYISAVNYTEYSMLSILRIP